RRRPPQSAVDRAPRASLDGLGLPLLVRLHRDGHRQLHLRKERQRALARRRSHLRRRQSFHPAEAGLRRRTPSLRSERRRRRSAFLALPEARRKSCHALRRLRNLRAGRLLQEQTGSDLQELRRPDEPAIDRHGGRLQSDSAESAGHRRCGCRLRSRRCSRPTLLRAEIMFPRLVYESFRHQTRRKLLAGIAITLGVAVATAMIAVATDIGDKINRELRSYGANLVVTPQEDTLDVEVGGVNLKPPSDGTFLNEADLPKIRGTFWHHNIVGFSPMLPVTVKVGEGNNKDAKDVTLIGTYFNKALSFGKEDFATGVRITHPWWKVSCGDGKENPNCTWPADDSQSVLLGERLATKLNKKTGDTIEVSGRQLTISGILSTGGAEDDQIVAPLALAQQILGKPGAVRRVYVSALTKPPDALSVRDPKTMTPEVYDRWYCSPYVESIAYQLQEVIPHSHAEQIRQVAQNEGTVLSRIKGLMLLITFAALFASALAVSAAMATAIYERRVEVGLMKALGAGNLAVSAIFFAEALLLALVGGVAGFSAGALLAREIGRSIFNSRISIEPVLFPVIIAIAVFVTFAGSAAAIRRAVKFDPVFALRGEG